MEFAVLIEGEEKGRWVLAVDAVADKVLIADDDQTMRWVPLGQCKLLKAANPEVPRPVVPVQPQGAPKLSVPGMKFNGRN